MARGHPPDVYSECDRLEAGAEHRGSFRMGGVSAHHVGRVPRTPGHSASGRVSSRADSILAGAAVGRSPGAGRSARCVASAPPSPTAVSKAPVPDPTASGPHPGRVPACPPAVLPRGALLCATPAAACWEVHVGPPVCGTAPCPSRRRRPDEPTHRRPGLDFSSSAIDYAHSVSPHHTPRPERGTVKAPGLALVLCIAVLLVVCRPVSALELGEWIPGLRVSPFFSEQIDYESNVFQVPSHSQ